MDSVTDSEQYAVAYEYLINSEAFERLGVSPDKVRLRGYNYQKYINGEHTSNAATFTFGVDSYTMVIVCHKDMDSWYVCRDCTDVA